MITNILFCLPFLFGQGLPYNNGSCDNNPYDTVPETPEISTPCPIGTVLDLECAEQARLVYEGQMEALYSQAASDYQAACDLHHAVVVATCFGYRDQCIEDADGDPALVQACYDTWRNCIRDENDLLQDEFEFIEDDVKSQSDLYLAQYEQALLDCCDEAQQQMMLLAYDNICDNNPFHEEFVASPIGEDYCDEGYTLNQDCVDEINEELEDAINQLNAAMAPLFEAICDDYKDAVDICVSDYQSCILAGGDPSTCAAVQALCIDAATSQRTNEISALFDLYRETGRELITEAVEKLSDCCEPDEQGVNVIKQKNIDNLYMALVMPTDPNEDCANNPYETAPGIPIGPINCPPGYGYPDDQCIDAAEQAYKDRVEEIASNASDSFNSICGAWQSDSQGCVDMYLACRSGGTPQQQCYDNYLNCFNAAVTVFEFGMSTLEAETSALYGQATEDYWKALEECCTPPEEE